MGYQRTWTAFNTAGSAYRGGDPGWIRHANSGVVSRPSYGRPDLEGLGIYGTEAAGAASTTATVAGEIATITQILSALTQTGMSVYQARQDQKAKKSEAADANRRADQAEKQNAEVAQAQLEQTKAQTAAIQAAPTKSAVEAVKNNKTLFLIGGGIAAGALLLYFMRRPRKA